MNELPSRRDVEAKLRECGLSHRAARKFVAAGWKSLVGEVEAENGELRETLEALREQLKVNAE